MNSLVQRLSELEEQSCVLLSDRYQKLLDAKSNCKVVDADEWDWEQFLFCLPEKVLPSCSYRIASGLGLAWVQYS